MQQLGTIRVVTELPKEIERLKDLAYNLFISFSPESRQLFRLVDPQLWTGTNHNPVRFLREVQQAQLERCAADPIYLSTYKKVMGEFDQYMDESQTWFQKTYPKNNDRTIAYFSAEFGLHESLPIYSGGLGVLAGDHLKSASDLGLPLVGVSLFYHQTYFKQQIDAHGNQIALYEPHNPEDLPLRAVLNKNGDPLTVSVEVATRTVKIRAWKVQIGRIHGYLLDTNLPENSTGDRLITSRLYGGDQEMRISQEIILGIGGVRLLRALGYAPTAWHMNEGHSVFLALERIRELVKKQKLGFYEAMEAVAANTIFTTHTPVPAGNDAFPLHFVDKYFQKFWESIGIRRYQFMELGSQVQPEGYEIFNLTILSLKLSKFRNGVSKLHGEVSRNMWKDVWPQIPTNEIPIRHITNGVHNKTWTVYKMRELLKKHLGDDWQDNVDEPLLWKGVAGIPDKELWSTKLELKDKMMNHLRERIASQAVRNRIGTLQVSRLKDMLNPHILTIGFARRFATYKRGTLIFRDRERLRRILNNPGREVQLIFSGKAHPKDGGGLDLIRQINQIANEEGFRGRVFFIENYDMGLARDLVSGVDVWLNNPRRPQEASGTSGQKVGMNAGVNFSVLDGWWCECYNGKNGFGFGDREDFQDTEELDSWDSDAIYDILENDLVPIYYARNEAGVPEEWVKTMKNSLVSVSSQFNTQRMVKDYSNNFYVPAMKNGAAYQQSEYAFAKEYTTWLDQIKQEWLKVKVHLSDLDIHSEVQLNYKDALKLRATVQLGAIDPADVKVQVYLIHGLQERAEQSAFELFEMTRKKSLGDGEYAYECSISPSNSGHYRYTIRVLPFHKRQINPVELGMVSWLEG